MRSDIDGADPESFHSTAIVLPPGTEAPGAGVVKLTSAKTKGAPITRKIKDRTSIFADKLVNERRIAEAIC